MKLGIGWWVAIMAAWIAVIGWLFVYALLFPAWFAGITILLGAVVILVMAVRKEKTP
jgi:hypothetical protein